MSDAPGDRTLDIPIVCDTCETTTRVPVDELAEALSRHNETRHDGEAVACVDPVIRDELARLVARDLDLL